MCGLLGPCFKTGHLKPFDTNAAGKLYLTAQGRVTSAHAHSEHAARYYARKCSFLENKIPNRHNTTRKNQGLFQRGGLAIRLVALAINIGHRTPTPADPKQQDLLDCPGTPRERTNPTNKKDPSACNTVVAGAYNPLFKVLCIFPSWYLFTIGLEKIFSFR